MAAKQEVQVHQPNMMVPDFEIPKSDMGAGLSSAPEDNVVPLIYVLNALSAACTKSSPDYIKGAEAGDLLLRNLANPVIKGDAGFLFQPCAFMRDFVEWKAGARIIADRHKRMPEDAKEVENDKGKMVWRRPNGNEVVDTRYQAGIAYLEDGRALPYVIPFKSTGHQICKNWMTSQNGKMDKNGDRYPAFAFKYHLTTKIKRTGDHDYYVLNVTDHSAVNAKEYQAGNALFEAFTAGQKKAAADEEAMGKDEGAF